MAQTVAPFASARQILSARLCRGALPRLRSPEQQDLETLLLAAYTRWDALDVRTQLPGGSKAVITRRGRSRHAGPWDPVRVRRSRSGLRAIRRSGCLRRRT